MAGGRRTTPARPSVEASLLRFASVCHGAADTGALISGFEDVIKLAGFDTVACIAAAGSITATFDQMLVNTRPDSWMQEYLSADYLQTDPVLREVAVATGPFAWSDLKSIRKLEPAEERVLDHAASHGMRDGFVVPMFDTVGNAGFVSIAGTKCDLSARVRPAMAMACVHFHNTLLGLKRREALLTPKFTPKEREVLSWVAAGKSDWQVGRILKMSPKTVNFHVENVKKKLGVSSRIQAVVVALRLRGLLKD